jgi:hypothetical protein
MPTRLVHQHNTMRFGRDGLSEFSKENVHRGSIEPGHHQGDTGVGCRHVGHTERRPERHDLHRSLT